MKTWTKCKYKLPKFGDEFNVVWDLEDGDIPVVTTMEFEPHRKVWIDKDTQVEYTDTILYWQDLPEPPDDINYVYREEEFGF